MLWRDVEFEVLPLAVHSQYVHMEVLSKALCQKFVITAIYAANGAVERLVLWDHLRTLHTQDPWLLVGDFNNVLETDEREGGNVPQIQEYGPFTDCLEECEIMDKRSRGRSLTWTNGTIRSNIDRALVNSRWIDTFPQIEAEFTAERLSGHTPCCLRMVLDNRRMRAS